MWLRARRIYEQLNKFIDANGNVDETEARELLDLLSANKALFINILKNAGRSAAHRSELEPSKVVKLPNGHTVHVDPEMRNEAIVISDTFNCDELDALELISTGEAQSQHFYYWTRGLCAIVCYYDTHRLLSVATKALVQMKLDDGMQLMPAMSAFLTQFCASAPLAKRLIEVTQMSLDSELHMLHHPSVNGLGGSKHQQILCTLIEETITNCRDTLYMLCSSWNETNAPPFLSDLLNPLKQLAPTSLFTTSHLCVWTAILMLISPHSMRKIQSITSILGALRKEFISSWPDMCVLASLQFASVVSYTWVNASRSSLEDDDFTLLDDDDISSLLKKALNAMVFSFLRCSVVRSPGFRNDAAAFETLDTLVKLFITYFPDKLVLLRRTCEEELSSVDLSLDHGFVPELPLHFEKFLRLVADLYDSNSRIVTTAAAKFLSPDSPALGKFLRSGKEILSPVLQITYLDMLKNLCKNKAMASFIFRLLSSSHGATADTISFAHFCWAIRGYVDAFRKKRVPKATADRAFKMKLEVVQQLSQEEVAGLVAWTQLAEVIALQDPYACRQFASDEMFMMDPLVGLLGTSIPLVLKGTFYRFLSVLARDGITARKIWTLLKSHSVLTTAPDGKLLGIQQELDERECAVRSYDSTLGFLHLMRALMLHPASTFDDGRLLPYLRFLMKSVISQFAYRSYEQEDQMWELCSLSCDTLCNLLKYYVVTDASLLGSHLQVVILTQVLSKSPVFRSMAGVLVQGSGHLESCAPRCAALEAACLSVLRLLRTCILQHANLAEAIRSSRSNLIIASLDSLLLDRLSAASEATGIAAIATFIMQHELLPLHAYWAAQILRDLCASRPTLQEEIVFCLKPLGKGFVEQCARMASPRITSLILSPIDPPVLYDVDYLPDSRIHAETARILIELCTTSIEMDPHKPNMGYFLCGFDMVDLSGSRLENPGINGTTRTLLHSVLDALEDLVSNVRPYALPFCALFEPMLRLLLRLVHADTSCGELVLRFLRSNYDLVFRLLCSCAVLAPCSPSDGEDFVVFENMQRMIQGYVLHLCAIEMSSLLKIRHYSQPARLYCMLLSSDEDTLRDATSLSMSSTDQTSTAAREEDSSITFCSEHRASPQQSLSSLDAAQESTSSTISHNGHPVAAQVTSSSLTADFAVIPFTSTQRESAGDHTSLRGSVPWMCIDNREDRLLWKFLKLAKVQFSLPRKPHLEMFNSGKLYHMASLCERLSTSNVEQCDIERMHFLLQREALSVIGELQEQGIDNVANEVHELLRYCVAYNLLQGTRASSRQLLSGWLSVVNVMAGFVPVPFISPQHQADLLSDALHLLLMEHGMESELNAQMSLSVSRCMCRLTNAASYLYAKCAPNGRSLRNSTAQMLYHIACFVLRPGSAAYNNRYDVYLCIVRLLTANQFGSKEGVRLRDMEDDGDVLELNGLMADPLQKVINLCACEFVKLIREDVCSPHLNLKVVSLLCTAQLLREDLLGSQSLAHSFVRTGLLRCILESATNRTQSDKEIVSSVHTLQHLRAIFILFIPLCLSESGWKGLFEEHAVERLSALPLWKAPPKQAFIAKKEDTSVAGLYLEVVELKIRFCLALCGNQRWRYISEKAVKLVECSCELLNHLMRNDLHHSIIQMCAVFISRIYKLEESSRTYIEKSVCLNAVRSVPLDKDHTEKSTLSDSTPSFNTPRKLFPTNV